jgi:hypothetical protein
MKTETFETLWEYCISNNRVCPMPMKWNNLFNLLKDNKRLSLPLILNGWEMSSPLEKNLRFKDHIKSAEDTNQIGEISKYLKSLKESDWAHYGEI